MPVITTPIMRQNAHSSLKVINAVNRIRNIHAVFDFIDKTIRDEFASGKIEVPMDTSSDDAEDDDEDEGVGDDE